MVTSKYSRRDQIPIILYGSKPIKTTGVNLSMAIHGTMERGAKRLSKNLGLSGASVENLEEGPDRKFISRTPLSSHTEPMRSRWKAKEERSPCWLRLLVMPLHFSRDVRRQDRLEPIRRPAPTNPRMGSGHGASKAGGKLRGSKGKAVVPCHARILPPKKKNAMRKIILVTGYALRIVTACQHNNTPKQ